MPHLQAMATEDAAQGPVPGQGHVRAVSAPQPRLTASEPWDLAALDAIAPLALRIADLEELIAACICGAAERTVRPAPRFYGDRRLTTAEQAGLHAAVHAAQTWHDSVLLASEQLAGAVLDEDHLLDP